MMQLSSGHIQKGKGLFWLRSAAWGVSDGKEIFNERMSAAVKAGIRLDYRYAYVNTGANPATNGMSWLFGDWGFDFIKDGECYIMQSGIDFRDPGTTVLSSIVPEFPFLAGLPDSYSGLAQAISAPSSITRPMATQGRSLRISAEPAPCFGVSRQVISVPGVLLLGA